MRVARLLRGFSGFSRPRLYGVAVATALALATFALAAALNPAIGVASLFLFMPAVLAGALIGGSGAAAVAVALSAVLGWAVVPGEGARFGDLFLFIAASALVAAFGVGLREIARLLAESEEQERASESRFRSLADSVAIPTWISGPDKACIWFNRAWLAFTGKRLEDEIGAGWTECVHPDDLHRCLRTYEIAFDAREPLRMEYRLRRADGAYRWIEDSGLPVYSGDGEFLGYAGTCLDITESRNLRDKLRETEARFQRMVETTDDCLWSFDVKSGRIDYLSPGFEKIWQCSRETLLRDRDEWVNRLHPEDRDRVIAQGRLHLEGVSLEIEYRFLRGDGQWRWLSDFRMPVFDDKGELVRLVGVSRDITGRKDAEKALKDGEERAKLALDAARLGIHDYDVENDVLQWDERIREIWGIEEGVVPTCELFLQAVHPDDRPALKEAIGNAMDSHEGGRYRASFRVNSLKTGAQHWVQASGVVRFEDGRPVRIVGTILDVTQRKQAEADLRRSEERYRSLFNQMSEGFALVKIVRNDRGEAIDCQHIEVNPAAAAMAGIEAEKLVGRTTLGMFPSSEALWLSALDRCARIGENTHLEVFSKPFQRWFEIRAFRACHDVVAVLFSDVSERHKLMDDLRVNEERLRLAQEAGQIGHWDWNLKTDEVIWSEQSYKTWRADPSLKPSYAWFIERLHPDDKDNVFAAIEKAKRDCEPYTTEYRARRVDGVQRWFQARGEVVCDEAGVPVRMVGVGFDVTELKQAEERARESELRFRSFVDATSSIVWLMDPQGHFVERQPAWAAHTGQSESQYTGAGWLNAFHPDDRAGVWELWERARKSGGVFEATGRIWCAPSAEYRYYLNRAVPIRDAKGRIVEWIGSCADIHDQRLAEEQVQRSEERLRHFAESDVIGITIGNARGKILDANDEFLRIIGFSRQDLELGHINTRDITPRDWWRHDQLAFDRARKTGSCPRYEKEYHRRDGTRVPVLTGYVLSGDIAVGFVLDLTGQKRIENELKEREAEARGALSELQVVQEALRVSEAEARMIADELQTIYDVAPVGFCVLDEKLRFLSVNERLAQFHGMPKEVHLGRSVDEILPNFADICREAVAEVRKKRSTVTLEVSGETEADPGVQHYWESSWFPLPEPDGAIRRIGVVALDVTQRHRMEEALRVSEERFRSLAEATDEVIWVLDTTRQRLEYLNPAFEKVWGESRERLLKNGNIWQDMLHPEDAGQALRAIARARMGEPCEVEYRIVRADGKVRWINNSGFPIFSADGKVRRVAGVARDVTDRRRAEEQQKLLLGELNHRVKNTLATVQSLVVQSLRTAPDLSAFRQTFEARIIALAKTHDVLTRSHWEGACLAEIFEEELAPYRCSGNRISLQGEDVFLTRSRALSLGLVVHELTTNAVKHGALSSELGTLDIKWETETRENGKWLRMHWRENGGPPVSRTGRQGFGTLLLGRSIRDELLGEADLRFEPSGVECDIAFPLGS